MVEAVEGLKVYVCEISDKVSLVLGAALIRVEEALIRVGGRGVNVAEDCITNTPSLRGESGWTFVR